MTGQTRSEKRRASIRRRIEEAGGLPQCMVLDCGRPSQARAGSGLHRHYCQRHVEHYRRHGSYSKPSYTAEELRAWRQAALGWLADHLRAADVAQAVERVLTLYMRAGTPEEAFRLVGMSPEARARVIWARLRARGVDPRVPLSIWLAVSLRHAEDPQAERRVEYRWVQAAKVLFRLSGGSHKRWERMGNDGQAVPVVLHKYPASRGRVLRHLGQQLAQAAAPVERQALLEITAARSEGSRS